MLGNHRQQSFGELIETLEMRIQLTESLMELFESERSVARANPFELRATTRFPCNGACITRATDIDFRIPGQELESRAIIQDLSRKGVGIITHQQWYPEQALELQMPTATLSTRVARVRKLGPFCYEVGLIIVGHEINKEW
jgi:hypothetical protein